MLGRRRPMQAQTQAENDVQAALEAMFDHALLFHGYTASMRDYELVVHEHGGAHGTAATRRYLFRYCVEADVSTSLPWSVWQRSLDDRLLDPEPEVDGYVWGVRWQGLYPGAQLVVPSARAALWTDAAGSAFREVRIEAGAHEITLVFSELAVIDIASGYAPFTVPGA